MGLSRIIALTITLIFLASVLCADVVENKTKTPSANPKVMISTSMGNIIVELAADKTPITIENFLTYVKSGFYDGTIFHRVIKGFMIQGGGFKPNLLKKPTDQPIRNEASNGLKNTRGTIAMARTGNPHNATAQFFINTADNKDLNHKGKYAAGWGYAVFGKVIAGMDVVDKIAGVQTGSKRSFRNVPIEPVVILKATIMK